MGFDATVSRPVAQLIARALSERFVGRGARCWPYSPPPDAPVAAGDLADPLVRVRCELVLRALLVGCGDRAELEAALLPDVVLWSPTVHTTDRGAALEVLESKVLDGDALSDVTIAVQNADTAAARVYLEWRLTGRFSNPCFIGDDLLIEPTGRLIEMSGMMVATFAGERIASAHCYYDDLAILEQLVTAP